MEDGGPVPEEIQLEHARLFEQENPTWCTIEEFAEAKTKRNKSNARLIGEDEALKSVQNDCRVMCKWHFSICDPWAWLAIFFSVLVTGVSSASTVLLLITVTDTNGQTKIVDTHVLTWLIPLLFLLEMVGSFIENCQTFFANRSARARHLHLMTKLSDQSEAGETTLQWRLFGGEALHKSLADARDSVMNAIGGTFLTLQQVCYVVRISTGVIALSVILSVFIDMYVCLALLASLVLGSLFTAWNVSRHRCGCRCWKLFRCDRGPAALSQEDSVAQQKVNESTAYYWDNIQLGNPLHRTLYMDRCRRRLSAKNDTSCIYFMSDVLSQLVTEFVIYAPIVGTLIWIMLTPASAADREADALRILIMFLRVVGIAASMRHLFQHISALLSGIPGSAFLLRVATQLVTYPASYLERIWKQGDIVIRRVSRQSLKKQLDDSISEASFISPSQLMQLLQVGLAPRERFLITGPNSAGKSMFSIHLKHVLGDRCIYIPQQHRLFTEKITDEGGARTSWQYIKFVLEELKQTGHPIQAVILDEWDKEMDERFTAQCSAEIDDFIAHENGTCIVEIRHLKSSLPIEPELDQV